MPGTTAAKYGNQVKALLFKDFEEGGFREGTEMTSEFLGLDVHIKYGIFWTAGRIGKPPYTPHVHDFDQVMLFAGSDMNDLGELGAEIEFCLGEEMETHMITTTTAVAIPRGTPHLPAAVNRLDRRFYLMEISIAPECRETPLATDKKPTPPAGWRSKYRKYIMPLAFTRKGAWHYGPENRDDGGGYISFIRTQDAGFDFVMLYENMKKGPYRLCPEPDKPHAHPTTQIMCFLGTDTDDPGDLGAEFEICLGKEEERHRFNRSTAVVTPPLLPHWPGGVVKLTRPIIMADIHPFGNEH
ncbi:MAG: hypothetical protein A2Z29_01605 [Chloroflexi bacterium RBG_16_56_11]|nr:MAG: hypothetical protein A2Z29_01605 [Chloroflexi bacterium RBG_16_56_11]